MSETARVESRETRMFRGFIPIDYDDDVTTPPPRLNPNDWVARADTGFVLAPPTDKGHDLSDRRWIKPLADGEIVEFEGLTDFGSAWLTIEADLTWSVDRPMPPGAASVECVDFEDWDTSVASIVNRARNNGCLEDGVFKLHDFTWTEGHRFTFRDGVFVETDAQA